MSRLFVAIVPPPGICRNLLDIMGGIAGARWQSDAQLHLTLSFAGNVDRTMADDYTSALASISHRPLELRLAGLGQFARRDLVHTLWAGVEPNEPLKELATKAARAARRVGIRIEERAFVPHITLARLNRSSGSTAGFLAAHAAFSSPSFVIDRFILFESLLGAGGATYRPLATYPLG